MSHAFIRTRLAPLGAAALLALLSACGGGSDEGSTDAVSDGTAQAMSANSSAIPEDGGEATEALLVTTQAVVAAGSASRTVACPGGGTALFTVTGASVAELGDGELDAGEVYSVTYDACRGGAGAASLDGSATLSVVAASADTIEIDTATQDIVVTLPLRTLTLNGSSTLARSVATNGATTTTTSRWISPQIELVSRRNARTSRYTLTDVDVTRSISVTSGVISARSHSGTHTMNAQLPNGSWSATTATQGAVSFDANGVPTQGEWTITLPHNIVGIEVVPGTATISLDYGADGTIDRTIVITPGELAAEAG